MALHEITPPTVEPFTVEQAKEFLRVTHSDEDAVIDVLIRASRRSAEQYLGRALITKTLELVIDEFPEAEIKLPRPTLQSVESIKYDDSDGVEQTLATDQYVVDAVSEPGWVVPANSSWPSTFNAINAVRIRYIAGYPPIADSPADLASGVPHDITAGMQLLLGHLYAHRESVVIGQTVAELPMGVEFLWRPYRVHYGFA